ncbi:MAG: tripartite tricarboxylate transporter substrate binding protein [Burkholderiales bacterium]|nr:tripartite tricarboxylate transporter substrate binding protein [Burkholderiales bacterium]
MMARLVAQRLGERWGQRFVVDNRGGTGGTIAAAIGARATPDGYTLTIGHVGSIAAATFVYRHLPYDPVRDFAPITQLSSAPVVLVGNPSSASGTLTTLAAQWQVRHEDVTFSSAGAGTVSHLAGALFASRTGLQLRHVPYKGASPALIAVLSGETNFSFLSLATALPQVRAGKLNALALLAPKRFPGAQEIPTAAESGYRGVESLVWMGLFAPAGTPHELIDRINKEVTAMLRSREARETWLARGAELTPSTPRQFGDYIRLEVAKWGDVIRRAGIHAD